MKKITTLWLFSVLFIGILLSVPALAQLHIGQYEDEAPFRTWNIFGIATAAAAGMGETQYATVADSSASLINPARLTGLPKFSFTLHGSITSASFDRYSIVNTGVLITQGNSAMGLYGIDFVGTTVTFKGWGVGFSIGLLENYDRPSQNPDYQYGGELLYLLELEQTGFLRNYNLSIARNIGQRLSLGIGLNYVYGSMEETIVENLYYNGVTISDRKKHDLKGFYLNGGLVAEVAQKLTIAAVFRTPYTKEADSTNEVRYESPRGNTDIRLESSAESLYKQPFVCGIGVDYRPAPRIRLASDVTYFNWSAYSVSYFEEEMKREFTNTVKVSGGVEYMGSLRLFQRDIQIPLRVGVSYDPQPIKIPKTHYIYYTVGLGLYWQRLHLDAGAMFGNENGSGRNLYGRKFAFSLSYYL